MYCCPRCGLRVHAKAICPRCGLDMRRYDIKPVSPQSGGRQGYVVKRPEQSGERGQGFVYRYKLAEGNRPVQPPVSGQKGAFRREESPGDKIRRYQRKLIPLNIVACILSLVAALSLFFLPLVKVDFGAILADGDVQNAFMEMMEEQMAEEENGETGEDAAGEAMAIDMQSLILPLAEPVFGKLAENDLSISLTAYDSFKVARGGRNALADVLNGILSKFSSNLIAGVKDILTDSETIQTVMNSALKAASAMMIEELKNGAGTDLPEEVVAALDRIDEEDIDELTGIIGKLDTANSEAEVGEIADEFFGAIEQKTQYAFDAEMKEEVKTFLIQGYTDTVNKIAEAGKEGEISFSLETFICVQLSSQVNIDELSQKLDEMLEELENMESGEEREESVLGSRAALPCGAVAAEDVSGGGGASDESAEGSGGRIVFSYGEIVEAVDTSGVEEKLAEVVSAYIEGASGEIDQIAGYYSYISYVIGAFSGLWLIQFLFAFVHIFTKNKRFCMWYTKLFCWIPCVLWLAIALLSNGSFVGWLVGLANIGGEVPVGLITGVARGFTSFTGVSGLCLVLMWLISVFWAFPVKRKIRKLKREMKD